ncbi:hypothetical protein [Streptomyces gobitricini]|uniref:hypothetical protein n=1 Tax=Streptomyces gobitricini TaxID=68211 RepID=UPI0031E1CD42
MATPALRLPPLPRASAPAPAPAPAPDFDSAIWPGECADLMDRLDVPDLRPFIGALRDDVDQGALRDVFTGFLSPCAGLADFRAYLAVARAHPGDPGLLPALMLRHVRLAPGEALCLGAGVPHAYLSGLGVEIMASSDNVLRCGLTSKHIDRDELLKVVRFSALPTPVLLPRAEGDEHVYPAPVEDFRLSRMALDARARPRPLGPGAPQIVLCTRGEAHLTSAGISLRIGPGHAVYVPARERVTVTGQGTAFRATVALSGDRPDTGGH